MNFTSAFLIGLLLGINVPTDIEHKSAFLEGMSLVNEAATDIHYYEDIYEQDYEQKQEKIYLEQVEKNPQDLTTLTELAKYYEELDAWTLENFNKTEAVYKEIIKINPNSTELTKFYLDAENHSYYYLDENGEEIDFYKKIEDECLRLLEIDSNNIEVLTYLGKLYSDTYYYSYYDDDTDDLTYLDYFDYAEKTYFKILNIDENNIDARYALISLYYEEWGFDISSDDVYEDKYFNKIEQQYLEILNVDEDYIQARYDLIDFYEESYSYMGIDCVDKIEEQFLEISKRETKDECNICTTIDIGNIFELVWYDSQYTDNEAFEKAEYYYKYALDVEPYNNTALYQLTNLYKDGYYYGTTDNDENFNKAEQLYKYCLTIPQTDYYEDTYFDLGCLYEKKWSEDKSDYTYYYMAENEFYNALNLELESESNYTYSVFESLDHYLALSELYKAKYEFDGDVEAVNKGKNLILEEISTTYNDEVFYMDSENQDTDVDKEKLKELGVLYSYLWKLDTDDMQYYDKAEKTLLKSLDMETDYWVSFKLGELYTDRWLLDKSNVEYKVKAIECFESIPYDDDEYSYGAWLAGDINTLLEKLEL